MKIQCLKSLQEMPLVASLLADNDKTVKATLTCLILSDE